MRKANLILILFFSTIYLVFPQGRVVRNPIVAYQSHPELSLDSLGFYADSTVVWLKVTSRLPKGGWFCADSSTVLEVPDKNIRLQIKRAQNIPWCPNAFRFSSDNNKLLFSLTFPKVPNSPKTINIVEECDRACFVLEGIILDEKLNIDHRKYNEGVRLFVQGKLTDAFQLFNEIIDDIPKAPTHVYGYSYLNLIRISWQRNDSLKAERWIRRLKESGLPKKQYYLNAVEKERRQRQFTY